VALTETLETYLCSSQVGSCLLLLFALSLGYVLSLILVLLAKPGWLLDIQYNVHPHLNVLRLVLTQTLALRAIPARTSIR